MNIVRPLLYFLCVMCYSFSSLFSTCEFSSGNPQPTRVGESLQFLFSVSDDLKIEYFGIITSDPNNIFPKGISFLSFPLSRGFLEGIPSEGTEGTYNLKFNFVSDTCTNSHEYTLQIISPTTPSSPENAKGTRVQATATRAKKNHKFCNIITWDAPKKGGPKIVAYRIYRDKNLQHLMREIPRHARKHYRIIHSNRNPCKSDKYYIVSVSALDNESLPVLVNIQARRRDCLRD